MIAETSLEQIDNRELARGPHFPKGLCRLFIQLRLWKFIFFPHRIGSLEKLKKGIPMSLLEGWKVAAAVALSVAVLTGCRNESPHKPNEAAAYGGLGRGVVVPAYRP